MLKFRRKIDEYTTRKMQNDEIVILINRILFFKLFQKLFCGLTKVDVFEFVNFIFGDVLNFKFVSEFDNKIRNEIECDF